MLHLALSVCAFWWGMPQRDLGFSPSLSSGLAMLHTCTQSSGRMLKVCATYSCPFGWAKSFQPRQQQQKSRHVQDSQSYL